MERKIVHKLDIEEVKNEWVIKAINVQRDSLRCAPQCCRGWTRPAAYQMAQMFKAEAQVSYHSEHEGCLEKIKAPTLTKTTTSWS